MYRLLISLVIIILSTNITFINAQSRSGAYKTYYESGKLKSSETYRNGAKVGVCKYYYDNGRLQYEESYNQYGLREGIFKSYYRNGQLESSYTYRNNQKEGIYKEYYENGKLRDEGKYENGERIHYSIQNIERQTTNNTQNRTISNNTNNKVEIGSNGIYKVVEEMPQYPGGQSELFKYISGNLKYPTIAAENGIEGRVIITFIVGPDGSITNVKVARSLDPSCDREALRVVKGMPNWIAGKHNGQKVPVEFTLPVTFKLAVSSNSIANNKYASGISETQKISSKMPNEAYYMFGTAKELKEANVISGGFMVSSQTLQEAVKMNKFIKIDIQETTEIPVYAKRAKILSDHPSTSYILVKDSNDYIIVKITDYQKFWSLTQFLIVEVG